MSKLNYNRPNNGYEPEPWQRSYPKISLPKLLPLPVRQHQDQGHKVKKIMAQSGPHHGSYKCLNCNKFLAWASKQ